MSRKRFYNSRAWNKLANQYRIDKHNICERCGHPTWRKGNKNYLRLKAKGEDVRYGIVHHKTYIDNTNINNPYITLNYNNLELLCINCHNEEHFKISEEIRKDVLFDEEGRLIPKE